MAESKKGKKKPPGVVAENRRARHDYTVLDTLECGIVLQGSEVKSIRDGNVSIAEGYVSVRGEPPEMTLHNVTIGEYQPAGNLQHGIARARRLLAHARELKRLARQLDQKGVTLVPLRLYFKESWAKVLVGVCQGRQQHDKRQAIKERENQRELQREMSVRV